MKRSEKISRAMEESGMSQEAFSRRLGVPQSDLSLQIHDNKLPNVKHLISMCKILNWSIDWYVDETSEWPSPDSGSKPEVLSTIDRQIIELARMASINDINPGERQTAIKRLMGLDSAPRSMTTTEFIQGPRLAGEELESNAKDDKPKRKRRS